MGYRTKYSGGKLGIIENNYEICVGREIVFLSPASVGAVSSGISVVMRTTFLVLQK